MSGTAAESSRTDQKFTRYGCAGLPAPYLIESSTLLMELHHALVFSFCDGTATKAGPSSVNDPLRLRSTNSWTRSFGCSALAVTRIGIHEALVGPTCNAPFFAGRTAPRGSAAFGAISVSATCVPFGLKFGFGLPSAGAA